MYFKLKSLYPGATDDDWALVEADGVVRITSWNTTKLGSQPNQVTIDGVSDADELAASDAFNAQILLKQTDGVMARVAEDLVDSLVSAGVISVTDLPVTAQETLTSRKVARGKL